MFYHAIYYDFADMCLFFILSKYVQYNILISDLDSNIDTHHTLSDLDNDRCTLSDSDNYRYRRTPSGHET